MGLPTDQSANGSARGTAETGSYQPGGRLIEETWELFYLILSLAILAWKVRVH